MGYLQHDSSARLRDERGGVPATLILIPLLLVLMELVIFTGRVSAVKADLNAAASEAARAGSIQGGYTQIEAAAEDAAGLVLVQRGVPCSGGRAELNSLSILAPGGFVGVEVYCTISVADLGFLTQVAPIGDFELRGSAVEGIDPFRVFEAAPGAGAPIDSPPP